MADFTISGMVEHGHRLGRKLGFPTANIILEVDLAALRHGVYASVVRLFDGREFPAVTNVGVRPTVEKAGALWAENYIIGFDGDLYGQPLEVTLYSFLRPERRFDSVDELRQAITRNAEEAGELYKQRAARSEASKAPSGSKQTGGKQ